MSTSNASAADVPLSAGEQLAAQLAEIKSLKAEFSQTIRDERGELLQRAQGKVRIKRPGQFYWLTETPYEHLVLTDGEVLWVYDIDLEQASYKPFTADEDSAPALLLAGEIGKISKRYTIEKKALKDRIQYSLNAINSDSIFSALTISFDDKKLRSMSFHDSFDQQTVVEFSNVSVNVTIDDGLFNFVPPAGIDVFDDSADDYEDTLDVRDVGNSADRNDSVNN